MSTKKYSIVMLTYNRFPKKNYLNETLLSLEASGLWDNDNNFSLNIFDSGSEHFGHIRELKCNRRYGIHLSDYKLDQNLNAAKALDYGAMFDCDYVISIEDDILVVDNWLGLIDCWLANYAKPEFRLFSFYTPYREVRYHAEHNFPLWNYPVKCYYGNQCIVFRPEDAKTLSAFIIQQRRDGIWKSVKGYDMLIKRWSEKFYPELQYFAASCPSIVQHVGRESSLQVEGRFHECGSFGTDVNWSRTSA